MAATFQRRSDADAARAALDALTGSLGIALRPPTLSTPAPAVTTIAVGGVSYRARGAVHTVIARHHGQVVIDVNEAELRRR